MTSTQNTQPTAFLLAVTEANHDRNEFYQLGGAGFDTEQERADNIASIDRDLNGHVCEKASRCYMIDVLDPEDEFSVIAEFEISEATAHALLGVVDFQPLREAQDAAIEQLVSATR